MIQHQGDLYSVGVTIVNDLGLHARAAALLAKKAQIAKSNVWVIKNGQKVDAKSVIDILTLGCGKGAQIELSIDDRSDIDTLKHIADLVNSGFGE